MSAGTASRLGMLFLVAACTREGAPNPTASVPEQPPQPSSMAEVARAGGAERPPDAGAAAAAEPDGPPPPPVHGLDAKAKVDSVLLLGESAKEVWAVANDHTVVIDKTTGCATESYPESPILKDLHEHKAQLSAEEALARPDVLEAIRNVVGLGRRFDGQHHPYSLDTVWSPNGRHIVVSLRGTLHRSRDGGVTFAPLDPDAQTSRPAMSPDGKHLVYESCGRNGCHYVSLALDNSRRPVAFTSGQTFLLRMNPGDSTVYFWRSDTEVCLDRFDLADGKRLKSYCQPIPAVATGPWPGREWLSVSPNARYGVVKWEEARKNLAGAAALTYVVSVVDLESGKLLKTVTNLEGEVDDDGNFVARSVSEGGGDHTYLIPLNGPKKLLGNHSVLAYTNKLAVLSVYRAATLGARKCDLLKFVRVP